jgi:hypothetical protein
MILKRMFNLAIEASRLLYKPHIPLLAERNARTGFFEREQFDAVQAHLPAPIHPVVEFAYITGWRIESEVLPLEWRRVFPITDDLRLVLEAQQIGVPEGVAMQLTGHKTRSVFERYNIVSRADLRTAGEALGGLTGTKQGQSVSGFARKQSETAVSS